MHLQITSSRIATECTNIIGGMNMFSSNVSIGSRTFRRIAFLAAALVTGSATSALASTVILTGGESGDGLTISPSTVLVATTAIGGTSAPVQGVTFAVPTGSATLASTTGVNGVTVTIADATKYTDSGMTYPDNSINQSDDNALKTVMNVISGNYNAPIVVSVSGLADDTQYAVDVLQSSVGYGGRTQTVSFSDSTPTETAVLDGSDGYNTHDVLTSDGGGDLSVTIENPHDSGNAGVLNAFVISSVPEPASLGLMSIAALGLMRRRRRA
jgi:hypothetical protein